MDHLADSKHRWSRIAFFGFRFFANVSGRSLGVSFLPNVRKVVDGVVGTTGDGNAMAKYWNDNRLLRTTLHGGNVVVPVLAKHENGRREFFTIPMDYRGIDCNSLDKSGPLVFGCVDSVGMPDHCQSFKLCPQQSVNFFRQRTPFTDRFTGSRDCDLAI